MAMRKYIGKEQALQKAKQYCAYQERSHSEVKAKLFTFGLYPGQVDECIATLIEEDYLNEERFAMQFAGGKFRMKHWGRVKIRYALKQKQVSEYCIKKGLAQIDEVDYSKSLSTLAAKRWADLKEETNRFNKLRLTQDYLLQKGYESDLIKQEINKLQQEPSAELNAD